MIVLWSIPFWLLFVAWCIVTIIYVDDGKEGHNSNGLGATITFIVTLLLFYFLGDVNVKTFFKSFSFLGILKFIGLYLVIGIVWSFIKWYLFLLRKKETLKEHEDIPEASDYKSDIIVWMSYWPWSMIWTVLNDPIKRFFNFVYLKFSNLYQRLSNRIFKDIIIQRQQRQQQKEKAENKLREEVERKRQERRA